MDQNKTAENTVAMIKQNTNKKNRLEKLMPKLFFLAASVSIVTTVGIVLILLFESVLFFRDVSIIEFFTQTEMQPLNPTDPTFSILPLLSATLLATVIAMFVAIPVGLTTAIYLTEFSGDKARRILKPIIEVLAGIPTIVYGFFAFTFITPILQVIIPGLERTNILSPGIVMGIMIIPIVASLSEDAMNAVPNSLREGAFALGATRLETAFKVIIPAAASGIISAFVLGVSRAIGETMIVAIASGSSKNFSFDVTESMQTMTAYIVEVTSGDAGAGTTAYYSLYAVGLVLFLFTLAMNLLANHFRKKYREVY
ncbi:phosphate ABC transporter permease subunit PstC [Salisediminibacterium halotolerans]|uniref:Phosphate transport system permease protein n=1 Tax=Salisediminibacterium halotolerans TaxID=517425 RepID=A0A1H9U3X1_9BACI|nr:phosphate ABC transporter permease subunit PstC [Salisediminibacterium haloalkalitolerans]SES04260.1 phosphate transport system permease protein [Salisediminibacterium haloalkalitolerans]